MASDESIMQTFEEMPAEVELGEVMELVGSLLAIAPEERQSGDDDELLNTLDEGFHTATHLMRKKVEEWLRGQVEED